MLTFKNVDSSAASNFCRWPWNIVGQSHLEVWQSHVIGWYNVRTSENVSSWLFDTNSKGITPSNCETFKGQVSAKTKHLSLVKLLQWAQINTVSKTGVMVIAVLKKVYLSIHSAKHQSTWFILSAYRIFYEVSNEKHRNFAVWQ